MIGAPPFLAGASHVITADLLRGLAVAVLGGEGTTPMTTVVAAEALTAGGDTALVAVTTDRR